MLEEEIQEMSKLLKNNDNAQCKVASGAATVKAEGKVARVDHAECKGGIVKAPSWKTACSVGGYA